MSIDDDLKRAIAEAERRHEPEVILTPSLTAQILRDQARRAEEAAKLADERAEEHGALARRTAEAVERSAIEAAVAKGDSVRPVKWARVAALISLEALIVSACP